MRFNFRHPYRQLTTATMALVSIGLVSIGLILLYIGGQRTGWQLSHPGATALLNNLGALLIASTALMVLWELIGKRAFAREVLEMARTSADFEATGITRIGTNYTKEPDWQSLFSSVRKLDIFLVYGNTWRNTHTSELEELARRGGRIRVYLPDPDDPETMSQLAKRFDKTSQELQKLIEEARKAYMALPASRGGSTEVFFYPGAPVFSCYRFDGTAVLLSRS